MACLHLLYLHLHWRKLRGLEHPLRWPERLGRPSLPRPPGPLLWFHAVSLGEGMSAIPVIKECIRKRPDLTILMTTTTSSAFEVIKKRLPTSVIHQFAPIDTPSAMETFLCHWKPKAIVLMESELWPNLIIGASEKGIMLALLNARVSTKSFKRWSRPVLLPLISLMLSKFSLIAPLSTTQAIRFQLLRAPPFVINFSSDLKYAWKRDCSMVQKLWREGHSVALRSQHHILVEETNILVVDTLGELRHFYRLTPIAVIGGSFFPSLSGHNISEAAAAGCAILTGPYVGHFSCMVLEMQRLNPLSVLQVSAGLELEEALRKLLRDVRILEEHRVAAKQVYHALSDGIVGNVWNLLDFHILQRNLSLKDNEDQHAIMSRLLASSRYLVLGEEGWFPWIYVSSINDSEVRSDKKGNGLILIKDMRLVFYPRCHMTDMSPSCLHFVNLNLIG
ncbi:hypothetical protein ACLB2K_065767 [Fragaria x ananassa]